MMSPLLQAAQAHFVEEEMRQFAAPKTEPAPEPSPPPPPAVIALPDESAVLSESAPPESTTPPPSGQIPEVPEPAPEASPSKPPGAGIPANAAAFMALKAKEREAQQEERRKQLPGGQIPAKDWFQPDPQEGPEIVRFTRIPGSRGIRRRRRNRQSATAPPWSQVGRPAPAEVQTMDKPGKKLLRCAI